MHCAYPVFIGEIVKSIRKTFSDLKVPLDMTVPPSLD